jgi:hypothetical protein
VKIGWKLVAGILAAAVAVPAATVAAAPRAKTEEPKYAVVQERDGFEVRKYEPRIIAEVTVAGNPRQASRDGFRILAGFIFGNNTSQAKVAMTAPVDRRSAEKIAMTAPVDRTREGEEWTIAFTMPSKYTMETLPKPNDRRIRVREIPATYYAVRRFSGAPSDKVVAERIDAFVEQIDAAGLERAEAEPSYARYDPPWTPSFLRRNEIMVQLEPLPADDES